jgi:hypothetical protein
MLEEELKSIMACPLPVFPRQVVLQIGEGTLAIGSGVGGMPRTVGTCLLVVHDHRIGVAGHDGVDHAQCLGFGVVAERLGKSDLALLPRRRL